jgi:hypothetical protein
MTDTANPAPPPATPGKAFTACKADAAAFLALAALAVYFLHVSWRKWPDPLVDSGPSWYAFWRLSQGALLYHDIAWNYGPLSAFFNAALFRVFGPGMMVLVTANLLILGLIVALAYVAFRRAWGRLAGFVSTAVFLSVFAFSHLSQIGNYNFITPYAHESTHGFLLILATLFVADRWRRRPAPANAFALGLCGGLAVVLKPEFMLAGAVVGAGALALRFAEKKSLTLAECAALLAGLVLPTFLFTLWFARVETFTAAFIDASRAWWMVLVDHSQLSGQQGKFAGFDAPRANLLFELKSSAKSLLSLTLIWAAGWLANRPAKPIVRAAVCAAVGALLWFLTPVGGWYSIGRGFPLLIAAIAVIVVTRAIRQIKPARKLDEPAAMSLLLVLLAGTMLARMPLFPRIYHFGFFQAALAGMVLAAFIVTELPRWTGHGVWGRCITTASAIAILVAGCFAIARQSGHIRSLQTQPVGSGRDRFYSFGRDDDPTGALVNWTVEQLRAFPPGASVLVLPEGVMINYLSRRPLPVPSWTGAVADVIYLRQLQSHPPDYIVLISRDLREFGIQRFGDEGNAAHLVMQWVVANYWLDQKIGGDPIIPDGPKGAMILRHK